MQAGWIVWLPHSSCHFIRKTHQVKATIPVNYINIHYYYYTPLIFTLWLNNIISFSRIIMKQLIEAVEFIHSKNIVHRDLKVKTKFGFAWHIVIFWTLCFFFFLKWTLYSFSLALTVLLLILFFSQKISYWMTIWMSKFQTLGLPQY